MRRIEMLLWVILFSIFENKHGFWPAVAVIVGLYIMEYAFDKLWPDDTEYHVVVKDATVTVETETEDEH
jgi:hypothetical protein